MYYNQDQEAPQMPPNYQPRVVFDGKRMRKPIQRKTVDYNSEILHLIETRRYARDYRDYTGYEPHVEYVKDLLPPEVTDSVMSICTKFVHTSTNKIRCPINCVTWTPDGRRLITGSSSGEFTLWNGLTFNFETILQAHDTAVRAMVWSHNDNWMISGDHTGYIKYWQPNMNNVKVIQGHKEAIRDLSFCPSDYKFVSCSDDVTLRIWDFARCKEEQVLTGHGWDVKSVDWHPYKSVVVSGSKDNLTKLWDAKSGKNISTLHGHKNTVLQVKWNPNGHWLATCSRDQLIKLYDIRTMREIQTMKGHKREVTSIAWHPFHEELLVSGGFDGSMIYWQVGIDEPRAEIQGHDASVWDLNWHPVGHLLCSGSNDHTTKFWSRNRPGDTIKDKNAVPSKLQNEMSFDMAEGSKESAQYDDNYTHPQQSHNNNRYNNNNNNPPGIRQSYNNNNREQQQQGNRYYNNNKQTPYSRDQSNNNNRDNRDSNNGPKQPYYNNNNSNNNNNNTQQSGMNNSTNGPPGQYYNGPPPGPMMGPGMVPPRGFPPGPFPGMPPPGMVLPPGAMPPPPFPPGMMMMPPNMPNMTPNMPPMGGHNPQQQATPRYQR